ncbi:MAG: YIP1 family protein [Acidobacteria bacterium]|nr:YIP1 family protein [Acidobacteriota bacterium]MBV9068492.1 YIP1 family protein [Acidobacteriota bacterium]MBV9186640.1 YIP1 family protein [Acidobacteriota bacterium]
MLKKLQPGAPQFVAAVLFDQLIRDTEESRRETPLTRDQVREAVERKFPGSVTPQGIEAAPTRVAEHLRHWSFRYPEDEPRWNLRFEGPTESARRGSRARSAYLYLTCNASPAEVVAESAAQLPSAAASSVEMAAEVQATKLQNNDVAKPLAIAGAGERYFVTTIDIVKKRPRRFIEALRNERSRYLPPLSYLGVNISLSILLGCSVAYLFATAEQLDAMRRGGVIEGAWLFLFVGVVGLISILLPAALVAVVLRIRATAWDLLVAGCYSSVLLPVALTAATIKYFIDTVGTDAFRVVATQSYNLLAVFLLARSARLSGRRLVVFTIAAMIAIVALNGIGVLLIHRQVPIGRILAEGDGESIERVHTFPAEQITAHTAQLPGNSMFPPTREWFDFDDRPQMRYSINAVKGSGLAQHLTANTTYYFRYVAVDHDVECDGEVRTFTTPVE